MWTLSFLTNFERAFVNPMWDWKILLIIHVKLNHMSSQTFLFYSIQSIKKKNSDFPVDLPNIIMWIGEREVKKNILALKYGTIIIMICRCSY